MMRGAFPLAINVRMALFTGFGLEEEILGDSLIVPNLNGSWEKWAGRAAALALHRRRCNRRVANFERRLPTSIAHPPGTVGDGSNDQYQHNPAYGAEVSPLRD